MVNYTKNITGGPKRLYIPVIAEKDLIALKSYKNKGEDRSLLRKYVLNHFYEYIVNKIFPPTLAPNTITFIGFIAMILHAYVCYFFSPDFTNLQVPRWVFLFNAVSMFFYQTMDNCDGKQARKTNTSSPLGDLFDHGCDALSVMLGAISLATVCAQGSTFTTFVLIVYGFATFIIQTWEEYYVGGLFLTEINGAIEGLLVLIWIQLIAFFHGNAIFQLPFNEFVGITAGEFMRSIVEALSPSYLHTAPVWRGISHLLLIIGLAAIAKSSFDVQKALKKDKKSFISAVFTLVPFFIILGGALLWVVISPSNIISYHPYAMLLTTGFSTAYFCNHITLCFILGTDLKEMSREPMLFAWVVAFANVLLGFITRGYVMIPETLMLFTLFAVVFCMYVNYVFAMFLQISSYLNIPIFSVPKQNRKSVK
jgi:ethanolaminephosphotransferase